MRDPIAQAQQWIEGVDQRLLGQQLAVQQARLLLPDLLTISSYRRALNADIYMEDPAWQETGNRDDAWLRENGFDRIAALSIGDQESKV